MAESKTSERRLRAIERQRQALELRKGGASFPEIAKALGYSGPAGAYQAVMSALRRTLKEPAEEVRTLEVARLDAMLLALWTQVKQGNQGAIDKALKVEERRAKLLGLDAPAKVAPTDPSGEEQYEGLTDDELVRRLMAILGAEATAAIRGDPAALVGVPADPVESPA
jgi:hypothetical protein